MFQVFNAQDTLIGMISQIYFARLSCGVGQI